MGSSRRAERVLGGIVAHLASSRATAADDATSEGKPIGLHGPLPPPSQTTYLRNHDEWAALAETDATKWFTNHRGKCGLPLLEDDYLFQNPDDPCIVPYLPPGHSASDKRTAILIMPGGGYHWLAPFEGPPIGRWCGDHGIVGFVLRYRLMREDKDGKSIGYTRDDALVDAAAAMKYIREHADQYGVDPEKVGAMGFSAGGDLCLRTGLSSDPLVKPDFLCPVYPAVPEECDNITAAEFPPTFLVCSLSDMLNKHAERLETSLQRGGIYNVCVRKELGNHGEMFFVPREADGVTVPETVDEAVGLGPWAVEWTEPFLEFIGEK